MRSFGHYVIFPVTIHHVDIPLPLNHALLNCNEVEEERAPCSLHSRDSNIVRQTRTTENQTVSVSQTMNHHPTAALTWCLATRWDEILKDLKKLVRYMQSLGSTTDSEIAIRHCSCPNHAFDLEFRVFWL